MKFTQLAAAALLGAASTFSHAGFVINQGFDNVASLAAAGWVQVNNSVTPGNTWFQGNSGVFVSQAGAAGSYVAADFLSGTQTIDNWLMTPVITLNGNALLNFFVRVAGDGFQDTLQVFWSAGAGTAVGTFTQLLGSYSSTLDQGWVSRSLQLPTTGSGRIGLRYVSVDSNTANYLGIDSLSVVPEPGSAALAALALGGLFVSRRPRAKAQA
jgi:MYXO-CTERM domain-containing protein